MSGFKSIKIFQRAQNAHISKCMHSLKMWPRDNVKDVPHNYLLSTRTQGRIKGLIIQPHKGPLKDTEREPTDPLNQIGLPENTVIKVSSHLIRAR